MATTIQALRRASRSLCGGRAMSSYPSAGAALQQTQTTRKSREFPHQFPQRNSNQVQAQPGPRLKKRAMSSESQPTSSVRHPNIGQVQQLPSKPLLRSAHAIPPVLVLPLDPCSLRLGSSLPLLLTPRSFSVPQFSSNLKFVRKDDAPMLTYRVRRLFRRPISSSPCPSLRFSLLRCPSSLASWGLSVLLLACR